MHAQLLAELRDKRTQLDALILHLEAFQSGPSVPSLASLPSATTDATAPRRRQLRQPRQNRAKAPTAQKTSGNGGAFRTVMRQVVGELSEPFDARDVQAAIIKAAPELESKCKDGKVRGNLQYWSHKNELLVVQGGGPGRLTKFKRSKQFSSANGVSARERNYLEFRKTVAVPSHEQQD